MKEFKQNTSKTDLVEYKPTKMEIFHRSKLCINVAKNDLLMFLISEILKAFYYCGYSVVKDGDAEDQERETGLMAETLLRTILKDFKHLTTVEVARAIKSGSEGDYGDFFGISNLTLKKWIKSYCEKERPNIVKKLMEVQKPKQLEQRTQEEKKQDTTRFARMCYDHYKEEGTLLYGSFTVYDWLEKINEIKVTKEEIEQLEKAIEKKILNENRAEAFKNGFKKVLENQPIDKKIIIRRKEYLLKKYFDKRIRINNLKSKK